MSKTGVRTGHLRFGVNSVWSVFFEISEFLNDFQNRYFCVYMVLFNLQTTFACITMKPMTSSSQARSLPEAQSWDRPESTGYKQSRGPLKAMTSPRSAHPHPLTCRGEASGQSGVDLPERDGLGASGMAEFCLPCVTNLKTHPLLAPLAVGQLS